MTINCRGKLICLDNPKVMGILNVTPDSFFDGGKYRLEKEILLQVEKMLLEGADILDVGGYSSRPGADKVSEDDEISRVVPVVELILKDFPEVIISVDTFRSKVARESVEVGASIVNDISAGSLDEKMFQTVASLKVPYVLMHMQGEPQTMQKDPNYKDVVLEVNQFLSEKIVELKQLGVKDIIIDPGFGFGKTIEHNYSLLKNMNLIGFGDYPVLAGVSRKSMIYKFLEIDPKEALSATSSLHMVALQNGAKILRCHDVKQAKEVIKLYELIAQV